jgi:tetratricopeptide (TPR) repeat protein
MRVVRIPDCAPRLAGLLLGDRSKYSHQMNTSDHASAHQRLREQAIRQIRSDQPEAAQATLEILVRQAPQDTPACLELADLMYRRGQFRASSEPLLQASEHLPRHAPLVLQLADHLTVRGEVLAARKCLDFLSQAPDPPAELLTGQANMRFRLGEVVKARELLQRALKAGADDPGQHHMHAMLLQFTGCDEQARVELEKCLQRWPHFGDAAMALVNLRRQSADSNVLDHIEAQLHRLPAESRDPDEQFVRAEFEYARFKTLDDLGRVDEAWPSLARCNAIMHALNPNDATGEAAVTEALIGASAKIKDANHASGPDFQGPVPIFIVGMPRSGTTLLDRMLSSHSQVASAGEINDFLRQLHWVADVAPGGVQGMLESIRRSPEIDFGLLGSRYLEQTQWRARGCGYYVDKLPTNIQMIALIRRALPHAPIIHMVREPMDVCFSNFKAMFGNISAYSYDMLALAHFYRQYRLLAAHWSATLPGAMLEVSYAQLVREPDVAMRRVLEHCGLDIEQDCLHPERNPLPVATPSSTQVREPIHTRSIGQWRQYAEQLEPLRRALS